MGAFCVLTAALSAFRLGASGGELLVPPRSSARMRPKGGAVGKADNFTERLPPAIVRLDSLRDAPPSLRNPSRPQNQYNLCAAFRRVRGAIPKFFPVRFNEENQIFGHFLFLPWRPASEPSEKHPQRSAFPRLWLRTGESQEVSPRRF